VNLRVKLLYFRSLSISFPLDGLLLLSQDLDELKIFCLFRSEDGAVMLDCHQFSCLLFALVLQCLMLALANSDIVLQARDGLFVISHLVAEQYSFVLYLKKILSFSLYRAVLLFELQELLVFQVSDDAHFMLFNDLVVLF
jgi:hypothetical protein